MTSSPKTMKVFLLICARHGTRDTFGAARTRRSAVSAGRARARGGSGSCAARRRPRGRRSPASRRGRVSKEAFSGKRPSRPPTRWTWTSTGISGMPQVKISTQAAVLRPTPGSASRNSSDSSRGAVSVQSRSGGSPSCSRIAWIRGAFCLPRPPGPDRLLDLVDRRVADLLPGGEALAQGGEGAVAVAVVGVLGEHGLDQLGDRVPVRLVDRLPVHLAQPVADRPHPALGRSLPGSSARTLIRHMVRAVAAAIEEGELRSTGCGSSTGGSPGEGTPVVYCHGNPTHGEDWLPFMERGGPAIAIDMPGWGRSDRPDPADFDYSMYGLSAFLEKCLDELGVGRRKLVVHDWGCAGADRRPAPPGAGREAGRDQRGAAAARLPLALGRADLAPPRPRRARQRDHDQVARWR